MLTSNIIACDLTSNDYLHSISLALTGWLLMGHSKFDWSWSQECVCTALTPTHNLCSHSEAIDISCSLKNGNCHFHFEGSLLPLHLGESWQLPFLVWKFKVWLQDTRSFGYLVSNWEESGLTSVQLPWIHILSEILALLTPLGWQPDPCWLHLWLSTEHRETKFIHSVPVH